jgi:diguanylate cyclase (GGDEF)-like protein
MARRLTELVREALPSEAVVACETVGDGLSHTQSALLRGRAAAIFLIDGAGRPVNDVVRSVQQARTARPDAELIVIGSAEEVARLATTAEKVGAAEHVNFLAGPGDGAVLIGAMRSAANRVQSSHRSDRHLKDSKQTIAALELEVQELRTRLDLARHAAHHDALTGCLNREGFVEELQQRLGRNRQMQNVLMMDLDRFKAVNDTLGHQAGDQLVRKICTAMAGVIPKGSVLARLGGDEFGVLVESLSDAGLDALCKQILQVCSQCRMIGGHEVQVSASIGVARQGAARTDIELVRQADIALYAAKREGKNRYKVFDAHLDESHKYRLNIERSLERGLSAGQFRMLYQPIVDAISCRTLGFEALVRWESPEHGQISPAEFIPIAEETGHILDIGDWIARQTLKDCRRWRLPYVSLNLSARQFLRHNIGERLLRYAADADVHPSRIQIELTETAIIDDVERASRNLDILRGAGVRVALDDFGTGYSSLVYLKQFAIDCIKIDKSFVDNITRDRQSAIIVASVSKLAASLGMKVVAEGVETADQRTILIAAGCTALQGYHFGRPVQASETEALLEGSGVDARSLASEPAE